MLVVTIVQLVPMSHLLKGAPPVPSVQQARQQPLHVLLELINQTKFSKVVSLVLQATTALTQE